TLRTRRRPRTAAATRSAIRRPAHVEPQESSRFARFPGARLPLASQHIVDVAEPAEIDVSRAPDPLAVQGRGEGQVNHFALEIEETAQRSPGRHSAAKDVVEDQALMAASRIEPERRIVAEIVAA